MNGGFEFHLSEDDFKTFCRLCLKDVRLHDGSFKSFFGVSPSVASMCWKIIGHLQDVPREFNPSHLLFGFSFLKIYSTEEVHSGLFGVTPKTFRKWSWMAVKLLSQMKTVRV